MCDKCIGNRNLRGEWDCECDCEWQWIGILSLHFYRRVESVSIFSEIKSVSFLVYNLISNKHIDDTYRFNHNKLISFSSTLVCAARPVGYSFLLKAKIEISIHWWSAVVATPIYDLTQKDTKFKIKSFAGTFLLIVYHSRSTRFSQVNSFSQKDRFNIEKSHFQFILHRCARGKTH